MVMVVFSGLKRILLSKYFGFRVFMKLSFVFSWE